MAFTTHPDWHTLIGLERLFQKKHPVLQNKLGSKMFTCWHLRKTFVNTEIQQVGIRSMNPGNRWADVIAGSPLCVTFSCLAFSCAGNRMVLISTIYPYFSLLRPVKALFISRIYWWWNRCLNKANNQMTKWLKCFKAHSKVLQPKIHHKRNQNWFFFIFSVNYPL